MATDTSVVVAAFASWHEQHEAARKALDDGLWLVEYCALETYSVLTRLPAPHRAPAGVARDFIAARFPDPWLRLTAAAYRMFVASLAEMNVTGGSVYDALVAATAAAHAVPLITCDRRAVPIYERYGIRVQMLNV
ncbi:MAG: PIN domain-containing protein [Betaproteobacteria bacterium]|nr:PIN domain-containing protein [Betaproteobacteria bacterium]